MMGKDTDPRPCTPHVQQGSLKERLQGRIAKSSTGLEGEIRNPTEGKEGEEKAGLGHAQLSRGKDLQVVPG